jgi:hypothetical protein
MNYKKTRIRILLPIIIIILIIIFFKIFNQKKQFDDVFFVKLFSNVTVSIIDENSKKINNEFEFNIKYNNTKLQAVNLIDTTDKQTLVYEKIAPGTQGNFSIILSGNKTSKYSIEFRSLNEKPKNLKFSAFSDGNVVSAEKNSLEELAKDLVGKIEKNQTKIIIINWYWDYENTENENIQDTEDCRKINQYQFDIYTQGEEIT